MKTPAVIVFSKDRPLQLQAYLESLLYYTDVDPEGIAVLFVPSLDYIELVRYFSGTGIRWIAEGEGSPAFLDLEAQGIVASASFDSALRWIIKSLVRDHVLFGCDDVIWFRGADLESATRLLQANPSLIGVSLRLGHNICWAPRTIPSEGWTDSDRESRAESYAVWKWTQAPGHWGYPFELMASVYRTSLVRRILASETDGWRIPNQLESQGVQWCRRNMGATQPLMAMANGYSAAAAIDCNRVQSAYLNTFHGGPEVSAANLLEAYRHGRRLDWRSYTDITPPDCFIGSMGLRLAWT